MAELSKVPSSAGVLCSVRLGWEGQREEREGQGRRRRGRGRRGRGRIGEGGAGKDRVGQSEGLLKADLKNTRAHTHMVSLPMQNTSPRDGKQVSRYSWEDCVR